MVKITPAWNLVQPYARFALYLLGSLLLSMLTFVPALAADSTPDWPSQVQIAVKQGDLDKALALTEARIAADPSDLEAHGWRARLLAWKNRHAEAALEYRFVLSQKPNDVDMLLGLADVLHWDGKDSEALQVLNQAQSLAPERPELLIRRGRVLAALKRKAQGRSETSAGVSYGFRF